MRPIPALPLALALLAGPSALLAQGTGGRTGLTLLRGGTGPAPAPLSTQLLPPPRPHPNRMTATEFTALRPALASMAGVPVTMIPFSLTAGMVLNTPGNTLTVAPGSLPAGTGLTALDARMRLGTQAIAGYPPYIFFGAIDVLNLSPGGDHLSVSAPIPGPGIYLITVYAECTEPKIFLSVSASKNASGTNPVDLVNNRAMVVFEVTQPSNHIQLDVDVRRTIAGFKSDKKTLYFYSCDFTRIK